MANLSNKFLANSQLEQYKNFINDLKKICSAQETYKFSKSQNSSGSAVGATYEYSINVNITNMDEVQRHLINPDVHTNSDNAAFDATKYLIPINLNISITDLQDDTSMAKRTFSHKRAITIPVYTADGMNLDGLRCKFLTTLEAAKGLQIKDIKDNSNSVGLYEDDNLKDITMVFKPHYGSEIIFQPNNSGQKTKYNVTTKRKNTSTKVGLSLFEMLRAYSGLSYDEIISDISCDIANLGAHYLMPDLEEYLYASREQCMEKVIKELIPYQTESDYRDLEEFFSTNILNNNYYRLDEFMLKRSKNLFSFYNRCYNLTTSKKIALTNGDIIDAGTTLTSDMLESIDNDSNITEIFVMCNNKSYRVVKKPLSDKLDYNFLANLSNILACEYLGFNVIDTIDHLSNKVGCNCYTYLKDFVQESIFDIISKIKKELYKTTGSGFPISIPKINTYDFIEKYKEGKRWGNGACIQSITGRNTISESSGDYKITSTVKNVTKSVRAVRLSNIFFLDSQASPESDKAGITQHLSCTAGFTSDGEIYNEFYTVDNGQITKNIEKVLAIDAYYKKIAMTPWKNSADIVTAVYRNQEVNIKATDVDLVPILPVAVSGSSIAMSPAGNTDKGRRLQMAGNHHEQYIPVLGAERLKITTGISSNVNSNVVRASEILTKIKALNMASDLKGVIDGIKLIRVNHNDTTMDLTFKSLDNRLIHPITLKFDYLNTITQMVKSMELNLDILTSDDYVWYGDSIVVKPMDVDTSPNYNVLMPEDISPDYINPNTDTCNGAEHFKDGYGIWGRDDIKNSVSEKDLAMGVDLTVAYLSWHGYCFEDGILIRQGLVDSFKMSNVFTHVVEYELHENETIYKDDVNVKQIQKDGLPLLNKYYKDEEVLFKTKTLYPSKGEGYAKEDHRIKAVRVPHGYGGYVQAIEFIPKSKNSKSRLSSDVIRITLGDIKHLEVGDKFVGHHGNKGVITKVLPDSEMPCLEDGTPIDICLNPLGVPSRMNLGQLFELSFGLKDTKNVLVVPPYSDIPELLQNVKLNELTQSDDNLITLYDNATLAPLENKVTVGRLSFMKLDHSVSKKMSFINRAHKIDAKTNQPQKSKEPGGQACSEYALNCILANKASKTAHFLFSAGSDDIKAQNGLIQNIISTGTTPTSGSNETFSVALAYLRTVGIDIVGNSDSGIQFKLLTDDAIKNITNNIGFKREQFTYQYMLYDAPEHYDSENTTSPSKTTYSYVDGGNIAWVNPSILNQHLAKMIICLYYDATCGKFKPCNLSNDKVKRLLSDKLMLTIEDSGNYKYIKLFNPEQYQSGGECLSGGAAILAAFSSLDSSDFLKLIDTIRANSADTIIDVDDNEDDTDTEDNIDNDINLEKTNLTSTDLHTAYNFWTNNSPKNLITNKLLLIPLGLRPANEKLGIKDSLNFPLRDAIIKLKTLKEPGVDLLTQGSKITTIPDFINGYNAFYLWLYTFMNKSNLPYEKSLGIKSPWMQLKDKDTGLLRSRILKKRICFSGRSTIVGAPELKLTEAFIPRIGVYTLYFYNIVYWLKSSPELGLLICLMNNSDIIDLVRILKDRRLYDLQTLFSKYDCFDFNNLENNYKNIHKKTNNNAEFIDIVPESVFGYVNINNRSYDANAIIAHEFEPFSTNSSLVSLDFMKDFLKIVDNIIERNLINERVILVREPALHRQNAQSFTPRMWEQKTIGINTLVCSSYNADFDGDQMAVYAILPKDCKDECDNTLSPVNLLKGDRTAENNYALSQDVVLGFYSATCDRRPDGTSNFKEFKSKDEFFKAVNNRAVKLNELVKVHLGVDYLMNTAGRVFVTLNLPTGVGYDNNNTKGAEFICKYDEPLTSKVLDKILADAYTRLSKDSFALFVNDMKLLGFKLQDLSNTTITLAEFEQINKNQDFQAMKAGRNYLEILDFKNAAGFYRSKVEALKHFDDIYVKNCLMKAEETLSNRDNLYRILKSGARGSFRNISEPLIFGGYVKDLQENFLNSPISGTLFKGFTPYESYLSGFEVRRAQLSTTLSTKDAGVMTRTLLFINNDESIIKHDCGSKPSQHPLYIEPVKGSEDDFLNNCSGKVLSNSDKNSHIYKLIGSTPMDLHIFKILTREKARIVEFNDGTTYSINYQLAPLSYKQYVGRYGYKFGDTQNEIRLTHSDIDDYFNHNCDTINVRLLYDCKCTKGICSKCYGAALDREKGLTDIEVGSQEGIIAAQVLGEFISQMTMDVKHGNAEDGTTTNIVARVGEIVRLSGSSLTLNPNVNSIYTTQESTVLINNNLSNESNKVSFTVVTDKNAKEYSVYKERMNFCTDLNKVPPGVCLVNGLNIYGQLKNLLSVEDCRQLIFNELASIVQNLNVDLDIRYLEIITHAMSRNSIVTHSNSKDLLKGLILDSNLAKDYVDSGKIECVPILTNYLQGNLSRGPLKAFCGRDPQMAVSKAISFNMIDSCDSLYSKVFLGIPTSGNFTVNFNKYRTTLDGGSITSILNPSTLEDKEEEELLIPLDSFEFGKVEDDEVEIIDNLGTSVTEKLKGENTYSSDGKTNYFTNNGGV